MEKGGKHTNKKPLILVSICAVILIVLASLSNVVGYQSVKSTVVNDSPLFQTRTQRATNQQKNILTSQYLGKGNGNLLRFPMRNNQTEILNKIIESIKKMDDKTFERFTQLCIQKIRKDNTLSDTDPHEIKQILQMLRTQPNGINFNTTSITFGWEPSVCKWSPGCVIVNTFNIIDLLIQGILSLILLFFLCFPNTSIATAPCPPSVICQQKYENMRNI